MASSQEKEFRSPVEKEPQKLMDKSDLLPSRSGKQGYVVAMVLGGALSSLAAAPSQAPAPQAVGEISRYCTACWRNAHLPPDSWGDCTQEVFCRLLERLDARPLGPSASRRA